VFCRLFLFFHLVLFRFAIALSVLRGSTASNYLVGIFKFFKYSRYGLWHLTTSLKNGWTLVLATKPTSRVSWHLPMDGGLYQSGISTPPPLFNKHGNHNRADKLLPLTISQTPELWSNMTVISRVKTAHLRLTIIVIIPYIFYYIMVIRKLCCLTENLLMREIIRLTTQTYNRRHQEVLWKSVFSPGSVIVFTRPEILLLSSTKQNIQVFEHLKSSFGIAKHCLPSYEVSVKLSTLERLFFLGL